jgi:cytochrome P450
MAIALRPRPKRTPQSTQNAPGPKGRPVVGSLPELRRQGQLPFFLEQWQRYGDTVRVRLGPYLMHMVIDPDDVHRVLVANNRNYEKGVGYRKLKLALGGGLFVSEGELWQRQRRLMQPPFTARGVTEFADTMTACTVQMLDRWHDRPVGDVLDINQEMARLAMDIIATTMFDFRVGEEAFEAANAFRFVLEFMALRSITLVDVPLFVPTSSNRRFRQAMQILDAFTHRMIDERRNQATAPRDLLSMLLHARDDETGQGMSERQLRDEVITIFFAGHETTAQSLTWTMYLLSQNPDAERRLHEEVDHVLEGRLPTVDDLSRLPYTRMVVEESMRLYPPIVFFARDAIDDDRLGGYDVPAGSMIMLAQYITQRHPKYWEEPQRFDPERFSAERSADRPQYAWFPFGGGPRTCLGDKFAMLEMQLVLATIVGRYRLRLVPGHPVEPIAVGTLRPRYGMPMTLEPRR